MKIEEALIRLRDDLKEWVTNNLNAIGKPKASDISIATPEGMASTDVQGAIGELSDSLNAFETLNLVSMENDNYTIETETYPLVYKNGFLVGTIFIRCVNPTTSYSIVAQLPEGYYVQGVTHYFQVDESSGDASVPRIFMHASASGFGVRGGQAGKTYAGLVNIACGKR